jgi:hypothetical protein
MKPFQRVYWSGSQNGLKEEDEEKVDEEVLAALRFF